MATHRSDRPPPRLPRLARLVPVLRAAALLALAWPVAALAQDGARAPVGEAWLARVSYVVDGDSIWVRPEDGGARVKLRLDGIDAPEICQAAGIESRAALQALAQGERVRVTVRAHDRWGRGIASVVRLRGRLDLAQSMVSQGWAWTDAYGWRPGRYAAAQAQARAAGRGLFAAPDVQLPAEFRRQHGPCPPAE